MSQAAFAVTGVPAAAIGKPARNPGERANGASESLAGQVTTGQLGLALLFRRQTPATVAAEEELGRIRMAWFGQPVHGTEAGLPLVSSTEPCILRGQIVDALDASGIPWRISYEGAEFLGLRAAVKAGLGPACLECPSHRAGVATDFGADVRSGRRSGTIPACRTSVDTRLRFRSLSVQPVTPVSVVCAS
ncbi:LysR substrate-binding domain-containing protein [Streptomyces sp. NPDC096012]|uniref:LysR substrate-binding domain-containing protein n=1 Tax=Streptomyces sp. NPDC096012 TaxID=3155684 RepID=UPI00336A5A85